MWKMFKCFYEIECNKLLIQLGNFNVSLYVGCHPALHLHISTFSQIIVFRGAAGNVFRQGSEKIFKKVLMFSICGQFFFIFVENNDYYYYYSTLKSPALNCYLSIKYHNYENINTLQGFSTEGVFAQTILCSPILVQKCQTKRIKNDTCATVPNTGQFQGDPNWAFLCWYYKKTFNNRGHYTANIARSCVSTSLSVEKLQTRFSVESRGKV